MRFFSPGLWPDWFWFFFRSFLAAWAQCELKRFRLQVWRNSSWRQWLPLFYPPVKTDQLKAAGAPCFFFFFLPDPEFLFLRVARWWESMLLSGRLFPDLQEFDELMVWLLKSSKTWLSRFMTNIFLGFKLWLLGSAVFLWKYFNCELLHIKSATSEIKPV